MARPTKYKKKYAKQLREGLRDNIYMSVEACCKVWGIAKKTYYNWLDTIPEFAEAAEIGERDYNVQLEAVIVKNMTGEMKGSTGLLCMAAKNRLGWKDKIDVETKGETAVKRIEIEVVDNRSIQKIEQIKDVNVIDHDDD